MAAHDASMRAPAREAAYLRQIEGARQRSPRARRGRSALRAELGRELDVYDGPLLEELLGLGITPETAPAFEALPLVCVAWADGAVDPEERWRVLSVATAFGLEFGSPAHAQLELWLMRRPPKSVVDAWERFSLRLSQREMDRRAMRVLEGAEEVAKAAGGLFGIGTVCASERAAIDGLREALGCERVDAP